MLNPEVTVGNLIAVGAALISAAAVLAALAKERALRKKELADRTRQATSLVVAKLDRWKQVALQAFDQLQAAATDADGHMVAGCNEVSTRDRFWKEVVATQAGLAKAVLDEEIEVAYSGLFGYDPRIHELFTCAVARLRHIESIVFLQVLNRTQNDILTLKQDLGQEVPQSAQLGNRLRRTLAASRGLLEGHMEEVLEAFRRGMLPIVSATDDDLVERRVAVPPPTILPAMPVLEAQIYGATRDDMRECKAIWSDTRELFGKRALEPWPLAVEFPEELLAVWKRTDA